MLEAIVKAWPVLVSIVSVFATLLAWIGLGVWKIARWTHEQDSRVGKLEEWKVSTDEKIASVEYDIRELQLQTVRHSTELGLRRTEQQQPQ